MNNNLKKQYEENEKLIHQCEAKIHELKLGDFKERTGRISLMGSLLYLPSLAFFSLINIPGAFIPLATLVASFGMGTLINAHMEKKANCKERLKNVSNATNESERLEEVLIQEMEIERLKNQNDVLNNTTARIEKEEKTYHDFLKNGRFYIYDKRNELSKKDLHKKISDLTKSLEERTNSLNALVDEATIRDKKRSLGDNLDIIFHSMIYSSIPLLLSSLSIIFYPIKPLPSPSIIPLFTIFGTFITTFTGSLIYLNKRKKDSLKAIDRIDSQREIIKRLDLQNQINSHKASLNNIYFSLHDYNKKLLNKEMSESGVSSQAKFIEHNHEFDDTFDNDFKLTLK